MEGKINFNPSSIPTLEQVRNEIQRRKELGFENYFPETGSLSREKYLKHCQFFEAGEIYRERGIFGSNRSGKTTTSAYELALHLTGLYPQWWTGKRFKKPIEAWASGDTHKTTRDIVQEKMLGAIGSLGTGMIPKSCIINTSIKTGVPDAVETVIVKHTGGNSILQFKSYDQRREAFQGTAKDYIWLDEEPPEDIYTECVLRTMTTDGLIVLSFTPLKGWTKVVNSYLSDDKAKTKWSVTIPWDDAPHLSEKQKEELYATIPIHQREARTKGVPYIGSGQIYPVDESYIIVNNFDIPKHFSRAYGMDVGWNFTASIWGALDRETDVIYIYDAYKRSQAEPSIHSSAIVSRGKMIGAIDPASAGSNQKDGTQLMDIYRQHGLDLVPAKNAVESGIYEVWERLSTGRLKIFKSCSNLIMDEMRLYRRDDKGRIVKENDHIMDSLRYLVNTREAIFINKPKENKSNLLKNNGIPLSSSNGWMY